MTCLNIFILIIIFILTFVRYVVRQPIRKNKDNHLIVSPCDGTVMNVDNNKITIFLSILDVHWQYIPINGIVKNIEYIEGTSYMAMLPKSIHNTGVKITFSTEIGDIDIIQKVGFFVRRIINKIKINDKVNQSDPYGLIFFGSRVDIILPKNIKSNLKKYQKVIAGVTSLI